MRVDARLPADRYDRFSQQAADSLNGTVVTVVDKDGKRAVGHVVRAQVIDDGRAVEATIEIGDKDLCDRLRSH